MHGNPERAHRPRRRFGQHFLVDPGVVDAIVDAVAPAGDDTVVEIGPGLGAITEPLAAGAGRLVAVEFDRDLARSLSRRFAARGSITIVEADALSVDFASFGRDLRIVGNLPYNISTPILFHLIGCLDAIRDMHFMLQREVVERMCAGPGSKAYGRLGIMLGLRVDVTALFDVPPSAFEPPPKVTSSVVRLVPRHDGRYAVDDPEALSRLVATAFSQRRKTLKNALRRVAGPADLEAAGLDPGVRPENVPIEGWVALSNRLAGASRVGHRLE